MSTLTIATKANQSITLPVLLVATYANRTGYASAIDIKFEDATNLKSGAAHPIELTTKSGTVSAGTEIENLIEAYPPLQAKPAGLEAAVQEWLNKASSFAVTDFKSIEKPLLDLDSHLTLRSYLVGYDLNVADLAIYGAIRGNRVAASALKKGSMINLLRWSKYLEESNLWIMTATQTMNAAAAEKRAEKSKAGASYDIALKDTERGVVTRFPPEPSGYLHIGHAKAACLNDFFAHEAYQGKLICRFDDTNPTKENTEFEDAIVKDLALMGIKPDATTHSSDYFQEMYEYCVQIIKEGNAYADDTDQEKMRDERMKGIASRRRDASVEESLARFEEMKKGTEEGCRWCIRAKISVDDNNKAMRDPVIYRCNLTPHHRTGSTWKIYPTYDFCVPILDSLEGVTHALRTIEYRDRNPQYDWVQKALHLRTVHIWDFARMNFIRTLLSKRKLTKFVNNGIVWGWDDPRMPTIRGIRRRGMTIGALREFILKQGPSRNIVNLDWTIFWATNKKYIDPVAPRHTVVDKKDMVKCHVRGVRTAAYTEEKPKHGKNPDLGTKRVAYSPNILIDQEDAASFAQDEEITLMNWGNAIIRSISHSINPLHLNIVTNITLDLNLQGDVKTTSKKVTWLSEEGPELIPVELVDFDYLITKDKIEEDDNVDDFVNPKTEFRSEGLADSNVVDLNADDIIQFERKGYFRCDRAFKHGKPAVFFAIPTGKAGK